MINVIGKIKALFRFDKSRFILGCLFAFVSAFVCICGYKSWQAGLVFFILYFITGIINADGITKLFETKKGYVVYSVWFVLLSLATLLISQLLQDEGLFGLPLKAVLFGFILCFSPMILLFAIILKPRMSGFIVSFILLALSTVNNYVYRFQGNELCVADFFAIDTALNVIGSYSFLPGKLVVFCWLLFFWIAFCSSLLPKWKPSYSARVRIISASIGTILLCLFFVRWTTLTAVHFGKGSSVNGFLLNFAVQSREMIVRKPDNYNTQRVEELTEELQIDRDYTSNRKPDIIVIMDESFADLSVLGKTFDTDRDVTPFIDSLLNNTTRGMCLSSVYGGWTPNSEYELLTGNSMIFTEGIVYQQHIREPSYSIVSYLKGLDYKCIAMHPYYDNGWKRNQVWPNLLFDECYFIDDFPQKHMIRQLVSDRELFDSLIERYENNKDENDNSLFFFCVTMQNHGGYTDDGYNADINLAGYKQEYPDVEQYLSLIHETDNAVEYLINYFKYCENEVVILFYGDHQPALSDAFLIETHGSDYVSIAENELKYTVPFFIWSNYDSPEIMIDLTSLNYLSTYLFKIAELPLPLYNVFLSELEEYIPAINSQGYYSNIDGEFHQLMEAEGKEKDLLEKYWTLEYNSLYDNENRNRILFP